MTQSITTVVQDRLCVGCGACFAVCPKNAIQLDLDADRGTIPYVDAGLCVECGRCLRVCPGVESPPLSHAQRPDGSVAQVFLAHATDESLREAASSGGVVTALAQFLLTRGYDGVLATRARPGAPLDNEPFLCRTAEDVQLCRGSRYAPSPVCSPLRSLHRARIVIVGKPCDLQGVTHIASEIPMLGDTFKIGIFCHHTPVPRASHDLIAAWGQVPEKVASIAYRGSGWPGQVSVTMSDGESFQQTYRHAWDTTLSLARYMPYRCYFCADGLAEFSDVAVGDPWELVAPGAGGESLVVCRTTRGAEAFQEAVDAGMLEAKPLAHSDLLRAQKSLYFRRRQVWGRLLGARLVGAPVPRYRGWELWSEWRMQSLRSRLRSLAAGAKWGLAHRGHKLAKERVQ